MSAISTASAIPAASTAASTGKNPRNAKAAAAYQKSHANKSGETEPPWELVEKYLPLVKSIVSRMNTHFPSKIDAEDLYSIGVKGLIVAISKYDASKKKSFGSYAILRIRGAILDELRRIDCMPRSNRSKAKHLRKVIGDLEAELRRPATEEEVRKQLGMNEQEYAKLLQQVQPITHVPIDGSPSQNDEGNGPSISDAICDPTELNSREQCESRELFDLLRDRLKELPETPRRVLTMYYYEEMNFAEIGAVLSLTESRICQIHAHAVTSLRSYLSAAMVN